MKLYLIIILSIVLFFCLAINSFAQQPIGVTKNANRVSANEWNVTSESGLDGAKGGSIFIDNYPDVEINKEASYWVAGYIIMDEDWDYEEDSTGNYLPETTCPAEMSDLIHWPYREDYTPNDPQNRVAYFSTFFQLFHSDIGGYWRNLVPGTTEISPNPRYQRIFFTRIVDNVGLSQIHAVSDRFDDGSAGPTFGEGDRIKFVMAFVKEPDEVLHPSFTNQDVDDRRGSFIYFRTEQPDGTLISSQFPDPPNNTCYNSSTTTKGDEVTRVYIGSDSHGNMQNWEPSITLWENRIAAGELDCTEGFVPHNCNPLMGKVQRMIFVQAALDEDEVTAFFNDPVNYSPPATVRLDFPAIAEGGGGYNLAVPFSHWTEYDHADHGQLRTILPRANSIPIPDCTRRIAFRADTDYDQQTKEQAINYGIRYNLYDRHEVEQRQFKTVEFYMRDGIEDWTKPEFHFYAKITSPNTLLGGTMQFYIQISPLIESWSWDGGYGGAGGNYLKVPWEQPDLSATYWCHYVFDLESIMAAAISIGGISANNFPFEDVNTIDILCFRGDFKLADLMLSNTNSPLAKSNPLRQETPEIPNSLSINSYPNPFNSSTQITYDLPVESEVKVEIFDVIGRSITVLVNKKQSAGNYSVAWNGIDSRHNAVPTGSYICKITAGSFSATHKLVLLK